MSLKLKQLTFTNACDHRLNQIMLFPLIQLAFNFPWGEHSFYDFHKIGIRCRDDMADIDGSFQSPNCNRQYLSNNVNIFRASESEPAVLHCIFTLHDFDHTKYNLRLYIDILTPGSPRRDMIPLDNEDIHNGRDNLFYANSTEINSCNQTSNTTIYKILITIVSETPTLIAKCAVEYFPHGQMNSSGQTECFSSSTFAIIPNDTSTVCSSIIQPTPTITDSPTPAPTCEQPQTSESLVSSRVVAPVVAILGLITLIETILLIVFLFVKYKKSQNLSKRVVPVIPNNIQTHSTPHFVDSGSVMTVSTIS